VDGHGGGGSGGSGGPDTITLTQQGNGIPMLTASGTPNLNTRTVTRGVGINLDTILTGKPLNISADTSVLVTQSRLNNTVINSTGHPKPSYGTSVNADSVKTDTFRLKAVYVATGIIVNNSAIDNAPVLTTAYQIAAAQGKDIELPTGAITIKSNFTPLPNVHVWAANTRGTSIVGNFTSDHYLFNLQFINSSL
jgi:hypothetical protein